VRPVNLTLLRAARRGLRATFPKSMHAYELAHKCWIEVEEGLLPAVVDRQRDAVDVGAYVGRYTVALAVLARTVYAFEPEGELATMLRRAAPPNVRVCPEPVAERCRTGEFYVPVSDGRRNVTSGSLLATPGQAAFDTRTVRTTYLDAALASADVGFVKIDVEGAELLVLAGAQELIGRCRPVVLVEIVGVAEIAAVRAFFEPYGYAGFFVRDARTW
jgi:FkbM family methyltransferase